MGTGAGTLLSPEAKGWGGPQGSAGRPLPSGFGLWGEGLGALCPPCGAGNGVSWLNCVRIWGITTLCVFWGGCEHTKHLYPPWVAMEQVGGCCARDMVP